MTGTERLPIKFVKELIHLLVEADTEEFELRKGGELYYIRFGSASNGNGEVVNSKSPEQAPVDPYADTERYHRVASPFSGVFYRSPKQGEPTYTECGNIVNKGDTLCIVDACKVMNGICADRAGVVVSIGAENDQLLKKGDVLFIIDTKAKIDQLSS